MGRVKFCFFTMVLVMMDANKAEAARKPKDLGTTSEFKILRTGGNCDTLFINNNLNVLNKYFKSTRESLGLAAGGEHFFTIRLVSEDSLSKLIKAAEAGGVELKSKDPKSLVLGVGNIFYITRIRDREDLSKLWRLQAQRLYLLKHGRKPTVSELNIFMRNVQNLRFVVPVHELEPIKKD